MLAVLKSNKCETCQQELIGSGTHYAKKVYWRIRRGTKVATLLPFQLIGKYYSVVVFCQVVVKFHPYCLWLGIVWKQCYCGSQDDLLLAYLHPIELSMLFLLISFIGKC